MSSSDFHIDLRVCFARDLLVCIVNFSFLFLRFFSTSATFEIQTSDISRVLNPSCCLPVEKETPAMRLVCDVIK